MDKFNSAPAQNAPTAPATARKDPKFIMDVSEAISASLANMQARKAGRAQIKADGISALCRLVAATRHDSGQSAVIGRFLLGLWNGAAYPFDLVTLRGLDIALHDDCLAVLRLDEGAELEVHEYIENGTAIWADLRKRWGKGRS